MKMTSRNTYDSLSPLTWLLKIFLINCNVERFSHPRSFYVIKRFFAILLLGSVSACCLYFKITEVYYIIIPSIKITDAAQMIYDYIQYTVDLWCVFKHEKDINLKYFKQYEVIDRILGITNIVKIKWKLVRLVTIFISIWLITSSCDYITWGLTYGWILSSMFVISYFYLLIKISTTLDMTSHVMHIEIRLENMADLIQQFYNTTEILPGMMGTLYRNDSFYNQVKSNTPPRVLLSREDCYDLKLMSRCYLLLTDQVDFINNIFGLRIILNSLSLLIDMIRFTNIGVRIAIGNQQTSNDTGYLPVVCNVFRFLTCAMVLISLVKHCENVYREKIRILNTIDHLLINKNPDEKLINAMKELHDLILSRPITFNMANFIQLNNSLLLSILSVVVTYTIILLQSS